MASSRSDSEASRLELAGGEETRERLITATTECLKKFGIAKTGVIDIVREAGSSRQTAYRYFSGRRELIYNAILRATGDLLHRIPEAVSDLSDPLDIFVESVVFLFREFPKDPVLGQAFGTGALSTLQPIGSDQATTLRLSRGALVVYERVMGDIDDRDMELVSEHVNRVFLSALLLPEGDSLLRADDTTRAKLRAWFGPTVERHIALYGTVDPA